MTVALIDADIVVYRAGYAGQTTAYQFEHINGSVEPFPGLTLREVEKELEAKGYSRNQGKLQKTVEPEPLENVLHSTKLMIQEIINVTKVDDHALYLTSNDKSNYRFDIANAKPYKGNRTQPKPVYYEEIREYLVDYWDAHVVFGKEADDAMSIRAMQEDSIICTIDKDLDMVPTKHYNFVKDEFYETEDPGFIELNSKRRGLRGGGYKWFYAQMLLGDSADNIPGIPRFGPVAVEKELNNVQDEWDLANKVYNIYKRTQVEDRFFEVADLLWIQRTEDERKSEHLKEMIRC